MAMTEAGFVNESAAHAALAQPAHAVKPYGAGSSNYVADWIMDVLDDLVGRVEHDLIVETSIDPALQDAAEKALVEERAAKGQKLGLSQGAIVAMTADGAIRALVGGKNYAESRVQPRRCRQAPAGLRLQALRLSHRAGARTDAGYGARTSRSR
jgi:penicillin-binding protein 1A